MADYPSGVFRGLPAYEKHQRKAMKWAGRLLQHQLVGPDGPFKAKGDTVEAPWEFEYTVSAICCCMSFGQELNHMMEAPARPRRVPAVANQGEDQQTCAGHEHANVPLCCTMTGNAYDLWAAACTAMPR